MIVRVRTLVVLAGFVPLVAASSTADELVPYQIVGESIPAPLTATPGNPDRGRLTVRDVANVTCLICHKMPIAGEPDQGEIGPPLMGVGSRYTPGELRLRLVNPKALNPDTIMPAYYRVDGLNRVLPLYRDRPIYTAQQIEDVVAFLASLKDP
jgi:L-cysteine S-thiosulfotransferase